MHWADLCISSLSIFSYGAEKGGVSNKTCLEKKNKNIDALNFPSCLSDALFRISCEESVLRNWENAQFDAQKQAKPKPGEALDGPEIGLQPLYFPHMDLRAYLCQYPTVGADTAGYVQCKHVTCCNCLYRLHRTSRFVLFYLEKRGSEKMSSATYTTIAKYASVLFHCAKQLYFYFFWCVYVCVVYVPLYCLPVQVMWDMRPVG